jgi:hypothetical protein
MDTVDRVLLVASMGTPGGQGLRQEGLLGVWAEAAGGVVREGERAGGGRGQQRHARVVATRRGWPGSGSGAWAGLLHASELEAALRRAVVGVELEPARLIQHGRLLFLVHAKVSLQDFDRHVIDFMILMPADIQDAVNICATITIHESKIQQ